MNDRFGHAARTDETRAQESTTALPYVAEAAREYSCTPVCCKSCQCAVSVPVCQIASRDNCPSTFNEQISCLDRLLGQ
eukprot:4659776-Pleurochrysis_carterae.AAC.1